MSFDKLPPVSSFVKLPRIHIVLSDKYIINVEYIVYTADVQKW